MPRPKIYEDTVAYRNQWQREHKDRISLIVPKGQKDIIKSHASSTGESVNGFINRAIEETMSRDKLKEK